MNIEQLKEGISNWLELCGNEPKYKTIKEELLSIKEDINDKLIVMIAGEFKAGKSTFINALLGSAILTSDVTPATAVVTKLNYGEKKRVFGHFLNGEIVEYDEEWLEQLTAERSGEFSKIRESLSYIELQLPIELLKSFTIVDTPGLNSDFKHHTVATERFLKRADIAIWLFHYRNVGTETEQQSIKKLYQHNIKPVAIVNAIDQLDEEDDDLDDFIDFHLRRLHPLVNKLIGVSAKEALKGKLDHDSEQLKWSNWHEIDQLFEEFKLLENKKTERIYQKLTTPLQKLDHILVEEKASLTLHSLQPKMESLYKVDLLELARRFEKIAVLSLLTKEVISDWENQISSNRGQFREPIEYINEIMNRIAHLEPAEKSKDPNHKWEKKIFPKLKDYELKKSSFSSSAKDLEITREGLKAQWRNLNDHKFFKLKKLNQFFNEQYDYNKSIGNLVSDTKTLISLGKDIHNEINQLQTLIEIKIQKNMDGYLNQHNTLVKEWNSLIKEKKSEYRVLTTSGVAATSEYFTWLRAFIENVAPNLKASNQNTSKLLAYQEFTFTLNNIEVLDVQFPFELMPKALEEFFMYGVLKELEYQVKVINLSPVELRNPVLPEIPIKLNFDAIKEIDEIHKRRKIRVATVVSVGVISFLTYLGINEFDRVESEDVELASEAIAYEDEVEPEVDEEALAIERLKEMIGIEEINRYFNQMSEEMSRYSYPGDFPFENYFAENDWSEFSSFYNEVIEGHLINYQVKDVQYLSGERMVVTMNESYEFEGVTKEYELKHALLLTPSNQLVIEESSYSLLKETEREIVVSNEEISSFLHSFRMNYMDSLNYGDFTYISSFLDGNSVIYKDLQKYVGDITGKGYSFESNMFEIHQIEKIGTNLYSATSFEEFIFIDDKDEKTKYQRTKNYLVHVKPGITFEIQQIDINDTSKEIIIEPTVDLTTPYDVENFIAAYYQYFVRAFNGQGFSHVESFYDVEGKEYPNAEAYMNRALEKNMQMTNQYLDVESLTTIDENHYKATLYLEDEYYYQDGTGDSKKIRVEYVIRVTKEGQLRITEIPNLTILEERDL